MASKNGKGPQIKRRTAWLELPKEYEGFEFEAWINPPSGLWSQLGEKASEDETRAALMKLVLAHNGWLDFDGNEFPQPTSPEFWEAVPTELAATMLMLLNLAMTDLPKSLAPKRRKSRSG